MRGVTEAKAATTMPGSAQSGTSYRHATLAAWFAVVGWALLLAASIMTADLDMYHEMALFREALSLGRIPDYDVFAYTPTVKPSVHHEWGTGAILYLVAVASGLGAAGIVMLKYVLIGALLAGCYRCARLRGARDPTAAILAPMALFMAYIAFTAIRAQLFTLVFLVCLLLLLEADRRGNRWWVVAWLTLYVVWLNLHAGFVVGAGLLALYTLERLIRGLTHGQGLKATFRQTGHLFATGLAMVPLVLVNPYGWQYVPYLWEAITLPRPEIREWRPLWDDVHHRSFLVVYLSSLVMLGYAAFRRGPHRLPGLVMVLVPAWLALNHGRHLSIYAVVWFCYVPAYLSQTGLGASIRRTWRRSPVAITSAGVVLGTMMLALATNQQFWQLRVPNTAPDGTPRFPVGAVDYLSAHRFTGNLMTPFAAGSYVSWNLHPAVKVSMDSRYEVAYPRGALEENFAFYRAEEGWQQALARYPTEAVLVPRTSPLDTLLLSHPGWQRVYRDQGYAVFAKSDTSSNLPVIEHPGEIITGTFP